MLATRSRASHATIETEGLYRMTSARTRLASLGGILLVGLLAFPAIATANTGEPIAQTGGMSATLPLFGTTLTVDVTLDTTTGNISGVALTPTGDFTQTSSQPEIVKFANAAGTTKVTVRAAGNAETIRASSTKLADFVGTGGWSADVFGTGAKSTVAYTIGDDGTGKPTLAIGAVAPAAGITDVVIAPTTHTSDEGSSASGGVTFSYQGFTKRLWIAVSVSAEDGHASLKITLSGKDRQKVTGTLAELAGPRTWSAHLCNGTPVSVMYHVASDGTIAYDGATGGTASTKPFTSHSWESNNGPVSNDNGLRVSFDGTRVSVTIRLHNNGDGTYTLVVRGTSGRCGGTHDGAGHHAGEHDGSQTDSRTGTWSGGGSGDQWGFGH